MLNGAQVHLALNHFPVVGSAFALAVLVYALLGRSDERRRLALLLVFVVGLTALPAYLSGDPAHETVEHLPGVQMAQIHEHEEHAKVALAGLLVAAAVGGVGVLLYRRRPVSRAYVVVTLVVMLAATALVASAAHEGGLIRHPELRAAAAAGGGGGGSGGERGEGGEHGD